MTVAVPPAAATPDLFQPPTSVLPPMKTLSTIPPEELEQYLAYLRAIYIPEVQASRRIRPKLKRPSKASLSDPPAVAAIREDAFERAHALRWLTACLSRIPTEDSVANALLQSAAALLAVCAGAASAGAFTRTFAFGDVRIEITDAPLENADFGTVGMQTWGGACVLSEMVVDEPARFFPSSVAATRPIRVLELGAGTGLVSLTIARLMESITAASVEVIASDSHPAVMANLRKNIAANFDANASAIRAAFLDWAAVATAPPWELLDLDSAFDAPFDLIVGADIVYEAEHARWLHACAAKFLTRGGQFHLVIPLRNGFDAEAASIESVFCTMHQQRGLHIACKETIVCADTSSGQGSFDGELEYWHFIIERDNV
ncbi:putative methyltransferase-domain-containing protein [Vararia minispora EC-137]|uniref:Methyltransferase-domain-containing protein n=1 Tax=Vararia minispora EC-137 TaxID=1314806 RepID=A0ACB8QM06_9AGAM|nr:putative methyltransferase-domain-containing protein [Vararia minispora EC-137]